MYKQNEYEDWPTTRRYPRTLAEAFPQDGLDWFEPPPPKSKSNAVLFWFAVAIWSGVIYLIAGLS